MKSIHIGNDSTCDQSYINRCLVIWLWLAASSSEKDGLQLLSIQRGLARVPLLEAQKATRRITQWTLGT